VRSWYKYEGLRIAKGQALLEWVRDNPNLQASAFAFPDASETCTRHREHHLDHGVRDRRRR
jgi:hypothetical protein